MLEKRVKIQSVVESQLPDYLRSESQRTGDFLKTYYKSVEYQGGSVNILENIDQYTKVGTYTSIVGIHPSQQTLMRLMRLLLSLQQLDGLILMVF